jgi:hypothetical protein
MRLLPSEGVKDILVERGIGVFQGDIANSNINGNAINGWVISISRARAKPNKMITIIDSGGSAPEPGLDIDYRSVQVLVRGEPNGYKDAASKVLEIKDALLGRPYEERWSGGSSGAGIVSNSVNSDVWASITMPFDWLPIGYDDNERPEFSLNFDIIIHQGMLGSSWRSNTR